MKLHSTMNNEEWKNLLDYLIAEGAITTYFAEKDNFGNFVYYKYATVEYDGNFYYMQNPLNMFEPFTVTKYLKLSPYEMRQCEYPKEVRNTDELLAYMKDKNGRKTPLKDTYTQRIFIAELYGVRNGKTALCDLKNEAGWRENNIMNNLKSISMTYRTKDHCVLRFIANDGEYFDYETKARRVTN